MWFLKCLALACVQVFLAALRVLGTTINILKQENMPEKDSRFFFLPYCSIIPVATKSSLFYNDNKIPIEVAENNTLEHKIFIKCNNGP